MLGRSRCKVEEQIYNARIPRPTILKYLLVYTNAYRNFITVVWRKMNHKFPIKCKLKDGMEITLVSSHQELRIPWFLYYRYIFDIEHDLVELKFHDVTVTFKGGISDGAIHEVFGMEIYNYLEVAGKKVVDIGANICDSAIYFALRGAEKVIAIEPFPQAFKMGKENILLNGLEKRVELLNIACGNIDGFMEVDSEKKSVAGEIAKDGKGKIIKVKSIETLVKEYEISDGILKMDCEGCENAVFEKINPKVLRRFAQIEIEYHDGATAILSTLEDAGFYALVPKGQNKIFSKTGMILAWRKGDA